MNSHSAENLGRVLELAQAALTDGSLRSDFLGRAECRTFVLGIAHEDAAADNLFGSANIGAWLQLHLANKVTIGILSLPLPFSVQCGYFPFPS